MSKIKRRTFLKLSAIGIIAGFFPRIYAATNTQADVIFLNKKHKLFEIFRQPFNKRIKSQPRTIAVCNNESGVQQAVHYANKLGLLMAIKSGGHSFEGFSLNDNGLVIDVSNMNQLELRNNKYLIAEPAVRLAQLYSYCLPKGRLLPSGSCGTVGLSGITLGGGYGLFSRQFGLTSDYLTGLRMVDIKGNVMDSDDYPELLWACRGAGNGNFGVVTQLRYNTVVAPKTLYQHRFRSFKLSVEKAIELTKFWFKLSENLPLHAYSAFIFSGTTITVMLASTEHDEDMEKVIKKFDLKMDKNYKLKPDPLEVGVKYYYGRKNPLYFKNISGGYYEHFLDLKYSIKDIFTSISKTPGTIFQINTLGGAINNSALSESSSYPHRNANYLAEAQSYWDNPQHEKRCMDSMQTIQQSLEKNGIRKHYVNYPDINIKNYEDAYYGVSSERLKKLKKKLDPENRFTHAQVIKPS